MDSLKLFLSMTVSDVNDTGYVVNVISVFLYFLLTGVGNKKPKLST